MIKYEVIKSSAKFYSGMEHKIIPGCTLGILECESYAAGSFDTYEEACQCFKERKTRIEQRGYGVGRYYIVAEYYIMKNEYDQYGNILESEMVSDVSPINVKVTELLYPEGSKVIGEFDSLTLAQVRAKSLSIKHEDRDFRVELPNEVFG